MAYTHSKSEVSLTVTGVVLTATGQVGHAFVPGHVPYIVRGFSAAMKAAVTSGAIVKVVKGNIGLTGTITTIGQVFLSTGAGTKGAVITVNGLDTEVVPGEECIARVDEVGAGATVNLSLYVDARWEQPGNITSLVTSAATA